MSDQYDINVSWTHAGISPAVAGFDVQMDGYSWSSNAPRPSGTATATSTAWGTPQSGYDGSSGTAWSAAPGFPQSWEVAFASRFMLPRVSGYVTANAVVTVFVRIDGAWVPVGEVATGYGYLNLPLSPYLEVEGIRLEFESAPGAASVQELYVAPYGLLSSGPYLVAGAWFGSHPVSVAAMSRFGQTASATAGVDIYRPKLSAAVSVVPAGPVELNGTGAAPGAQVQLYRDGMAAEQTVADANGGFFAQAALAEGLNTFVAQAVDGAGNRSVNSTEVSVTMDSPPAAALTLLLDGVVGAEVSLSFTANGDTSKVSGFKVRRSTAAQPATDIATLAATARAYVDGSRPNGTYVYSVAAVNGSGFAGSPSNEVTATVGVTPLPAPAGLAVSAPPAGGALDLVWTFSGAAPAGFRVERAPSAQGPFQQAGVVDGTVTSWVDHGLTNGATYFYRVTALDVFGNASPPSAVVSGTPLDTEAPAAPEFRSPTVAGQPVTLYSPTTAVSGKAEPGSTVELYRNGQSVGSTLARNGGVAKRPVATAFVPRDAFAVSRDGLAVAYTYLPAGSSVYSLAVEDLRAGTVRTFQAPSGIGLGAGTTFSPDGRFLAMNTTSQLDYYEHIHVVDLSNGAFIPVAAPFAGGESVPAWSPDSSKLAYSASRANLPGVAEFDRATSAERVVASSSSMYLHGVRWLGQDALVAVVEPESWGLPYTVSRFEVATGARTILFSASYIDRVDPSPDASSAAVVACDPQCDLHLLNLASLQAERLTNDAAFERSAVFSPDGALLAYSSGGTLYLRQIGAAQNASLGVLGDGPLDWNSASLAYLEYGSSIEWLDFEGRFEFPAVTLVPGANHFVARASDGSGNHSAPSAAIEVTFSAAQLADLAVSATVQPQIPVAGSPANAFVTIRNVGYSAAAAPVIAATLIGSDGSLRISPRITLSGSMGVGAVATAVVPLDIAGLTGLQRIRVVADPDGVIADANRANNDVEVQFSVAANEDLGLSVQAAPASVTAYGTVAVQVAVANPGPAKNVEVHVALVSADGAEVLAAGPAELFAPLGGSATASFGRTLDVGATLAGSYDVAVVASSAGLVIARATAPLEVLPDRTTGLSLSSMRASYLTGEDVTVLGQVSNLSPNAMLSGAEYRVRLESGSGAAVGSTSAALSMLPLGAAATQTTVFSSAGLLPGDYRAIAEVVLGTEVLASASATVPVVGRAALTGSLLLQGASGSPPAVPSGSSAILAYGVDNLGNAAALDVTVHVAVVDPDTLAIIASQVIPVGPMAAGAVANGTLQFATTGLALKTYAVSLYVDHDGLTGEVLATTRFRVADSAAPALYVLNLSDGMFVQGSVSAVVRAVDAVSGTSAVRVAVDGQALAALGLASGTPLDGTWSGALPLGAEGPHTLQFSARDLEGNDGLVSPASLNPVSLTVVVDTVAPVVTIAGVADGALLNLPVTPVISATDANLSTVVSNLDGQPFASGAQVAADGDFTLSAEATDKAGNRATQVVRFTLDQTPPSVSVYGVADGQVTNQDVAPVVTVSDLHPGSSAVTLNGQPFVPGSVLSAEGSYLLAVSASDAAGNTTSESIGFTIDKTPPIVTVAGVIDGSFVNASVTPSFSATDGNLLGVTATLDGVPFAPGETVSAEGAHTLVVTAFDLGGNSVTNTVSFTIDRTPPVISLAGVADGAIVNVDVTPSFSVQDANLLSSSATLNGQPFSSGTLVSAEGQYQLAVSASDQAGNQASASLSFTIDKTGPAITVTGVADGAFYRVDVSPGFSAQDPHLLSVDATLDGQPFVSGTIVSAEGAHVLVVTASDEAGNTATASIAFATDKTAPVISLGGVADGAFVGTDVTLTFTCQDPNPASCDATLNGQPFTSGTQVSGEGAYVLVMNAADKAGNTAMQTAGFTIDKTPPAITLGGVTDGSFVRFDATPTFSCQDVNPDSCSATLNGLPFTSGTVVSVEATYDLVVTATDKAGNTATQTARFTLDKTPPAITVGGVSNGSFAGDDTPTFSCQDANPGSCSATLNGQPFTSGALVSAEGDYTLEVTAADKAGNTASRTVTFTIDKTPPVITVTGVSGGVEYDDAVIPVITAADPHLAQLTVTLNGAPFVSGTPVEDDGVYVLYARAHDGAGNVSELTVNFSLLLVKFQVDKHLLGKSTRALALLQSGRRPLAAPDRSRVEAFLDVQLGAAGGWLDVAGDEAAFLASLRSGFYNVFLLVNLDGPGCGEDDVEEGEEGEDDGGAAVEAENEDDCEEEDEPDEAAEHAREAIALELTEQVFAGRAGAVAMRTRRENLPKLREVFGLDLQGRANKAQVSFVAPVLGPLADLGLVGRAVRLKLTGATVLAQYVPAAQPSQVAAAANSLGLGKSVSFGFDLSQATPGGDAGLALRSAVSFVTPAPGLLSPLSVAGVEVGVTNLAKATQTRVRETLSAPLWAVDARPQASISASRQLIEWAFPLARDEAKSLRYFVRLPDAAGTYATYTELAAIRPTGTRVFGTFGLDLTVSGTGTDLLLAAQATAALLPASGHDGVLRGKIESELTKVQLRPVASRADIEENLENLLEAVEDAERLNSSNKTSVRLAVDELIRYWEARWYVF
ncbi:MAG: Ig-like domain-containing protein [Myxococcaceae bacterium]